MLTLSEKHIIGKKHKYFKELDELSFLSKNLYNCCLYNIRQEYFKTTKFLHLKDNYQLVKTNQTVDYYALPAKVSNHVVNQVDAQFKYYFKALKDFKKNPNKYQGMPKPPYYKHKTNGRNIVSYEKGAISKPLLVKNGIIKLSMTNIEIKTKVSYNDLKMVTITKQGNGYCINVVYKCNIPQLKKDNGRYAGIDLGVNNLMTVAFNTGDVPLLINGRPIKSMNQYSNKKKASIQSELKIKNNKDTSKSIGDLMNKRNNKMNDYLHKSSRMLVNQLVSKNITKLVIGYNQEWKQDINIGKKNNQNFVNIPHYKLINMITYKCKMLGIEVIMVGEAYTSKCSFLDLEPIKKHDTYKGNRIKRGMFVASNGRRINADVNAAYNILRKAIPTAICNGIDGLAVDQPTKLNIIY